LSSVDVIVKVVKEIANAFSIDSIFVDLNDREILISEDFEADDFTKLMGVLSKYPVEWRFEVNRGLVIRVKEGSEG